MKALLKWCIQDCLVGYEEEAYPVPFSWERLRRHAPVRLLLTDMDGTFLDSSHKASASNVAAFASLRSHGIIPVVATGRPRHSVIAGVGRAVYERMVPNGKGPGIFMNGSVVYGLSGELLFERHIELNDLEQVFKVLDQIGWRDRVCGYNEQGVYCEDENDFNFRLHTEYGEPRPLVVDKGQLRTMNFSKLIINGTDETIDKLRTALEPQLGRGVRCVRPLTWNLEVIPADISKATGMQVLLDHLGLTKANVAAMGDSENDVEMLRKAAVPIVVENGTDAAKRAALYQTVSNDQNAFAHVATELLIHQAHSTTK
ncbi:Cof family hydrolase subfamily protein [Besnoitia besnoiti]|uniref:Cof family hydrolase subfamily protein n=1 Tax=Besnoitia besnoiti TaxID=94643 RepID=A0A2A9MBZ6_BESBE|nr:Cof family hydrolase subfamily protein [Besnoitia besnoiti]PFH33137.1 Cof family hydrolase subfamily protein [Besnoitia besnoiti]